MLRKRGHRVQVVADGRQAVDALAQTDYDVVLMDLQMPVLDGLQATGEIRRQRGERPLPIIAVTANALAGERERCIAAGMDDYLAKPFKPHELFAVVEGWGGPGPMSTRQSSPPVDLDALRKELDSAGISGMVFELLGIFLRDAPGRLGALRAAVAGREAGDIERAAHALKSAAGAVHARGLGDLLREAEGAARSGDVEAAAALLERIVTEAGAVERFLGEQGVTAA
jgi:CheY-like chemotaxis protein